MDSIIHLKELDYILSYFVQYHNKKLFISLMNEHEMESENMILNIISMLMTNQYLPYKTFGLKADVLGISINNIEYTNMSAPLTEKVGVETHELFYQ